MLFYLGILLIPLFVAIALVWVFFSGHREKTDETGWIQAHPHQAHHSRTEGREP